MNEYATYKEMKKAHEDTMNSMPLAFAFSNEQFYKIMREWGLAHGRGKNEGKPTENDKKQIVSIGYGGFIQKKDLEMYMNECKRLRDEEKHFQKDLQKFKEQIVYEMHNHEYAINWEGDENVCEAIGRDVKDLENDKDFSNVYMDARKQYFKEAEEYL